MRIAEIGAKKYPSREGGVDVVVQKLAQYFCKAGDDVTCFVSRKSTDPIADGVKVVQIPTIHKKATEAVIYSYLATREAKKGRFDIVHFHAEGNCLFLHKMKKSTSKLIVTIHGLDWKRGKFKGLGSRILLESEKQIAKYADVIITLSQHDHDYMEDTYGVSSIIIPNGYEESLQIPASLIDQRFGLHKDEYFLFLARIVPEKGLHYLIKAYKDIESKLQGKKLVVAGASSYTDKYFQEIQKMANTDKNIIFTGFAKNQLLGELLSNAYYYVLPSDIEGMPLSLVEALGYGRECIASDIPENKIDDGNILFFKHGNVDSLESVLLEAIEKGNHFDKKTIKIPTWDAVCLKTEELYKN
jgi:glycosyltransferase involved in cell wall biosynthesis